MRVFSIINYSHRTQGFANQVEPGVTSTHKEFNPPPTLNNLSNLLLELD